MNNTAWLVIDGYEDEPAAFGVPPYVGFHIRYICGVLEHHRIDYTYLTIDQIRAARRQGTLGKCFNNVDGVVILAGAIVPGKYVRGTPISRKELDTLIGDIQTETVIICGGWAIRGWRQRGWAPSRPNLFLAHHDLDATLDTFLQTKSFQHVRRTTKQWHQWARAGASSKAITTHPDLPDPLTVEIELYQGCVRFQRGCRFCIEPKKGAPINRSVGSVIDEVNAALDAGAQHVRLGGATCIYTWQAEGVGELMRWKGTQRAMETQEQAMLRLQAVMVKFGVAMVEVRRARGDLGLGEKGAGGEPPQCEKCGRKDVYIPRGNIAGGGARFCQACLDEMVGEAAGEECLLCGGDTEGGGVCGRCLRMVEAARFRRD